MTYEVVINILKENNLLCDRVIHNGAIVALQLYCPSLQSEWRMDAVNELLPDGFVATFFPNEEFVEVKKKST